MTLRARLVREEYVGENRCWPCTAVNGALVTLAALAIAAVSWPLALVAFAAGALAIAYRGYVVPATPRFAPHLVARLPVDFGPTKRAPPTKRRTDGAPVDADDSATGDESAIPDDGGPDGEPAAAPDGDAVFDALVEAGVLEADTEGVALADSFRQEWRERIEDIRDGDIAAAVDRVRPDVAVDAHTDESGDTWVVVGAGDAAEEWLAVPVAVADVAAVDALSARDIERGVALAATAPLRGLLERCPVCDGPLDWEEEGCCGGYGPDGPGRLLACAACDAAVFAE